MSLSGRVALVTGGGRGIGRAISLALAEDGASIAINYRRDEDAANETVAEIEAAGGVARAYCASVDQYEEDREMVATIEADLGAIGILINNAGIASRGMSVADTDPDELRRVVSTHAFAAHYLSTHSSRAPLAVLRRLACKCNITTSALGFKAQKHTT